MDEISMKEWLSIKEIDYDEKINLPVGDIFLQGKNMINQKMNKKPGNMVSVYIVTSVKGKSVGYMVKQYRLTDKQDDKRKWNEKINLDKWYDSFSMG